MKKLALLLFFLSMQVQAQSLSMGPCIWSGDFTRCLPPVGLFLNNGRSLSLGPDTNDGHYVELKADPTLAAGYSLAFPATNGINNQSFLYDGAGHLAWYTPFTSASFTAYKTELPMKFAAEAASTANVNMAAGNPGTIDGYDVSFGATVLLKNQTDKSENGLWRVDISGVWTRDPTMPDNITSAYSAIVPVGPGGTVNGNTIWYSQSLGDTNVPFVQIPTTASDVPITGSRALVSTAAGFIAPALTTATELGYVHNVTSAIQTQLDAKVTNPMSAAGDLIRGGVAGAPARLAPGTANDVLHSGTTPSWSGVSLTADVTGTLPTGNGGTGITSFGTGVATWLNAPSSAHLRAALSDSSGTGTAIFGTSPTFTTSYLLAGSSSGTTTVQAAAAASGTLTLPAATDTLVGKATTDTLTNKTLSGNTATNLVSGSGTLTLNTSGTATVPNATDTLVGKATTDVLTNKDISSTTNTYRAASSTVTGAISYEGTTTYSNGGTTLTWGGVSGAPATYTVVFVRTGKQVTVNILFSSVTINATTPVQISGYSSDYTPASAKWGLLPIVTNATNNTAAIDADSDGHLYIYKSAAAASWVNTNTTDSGSARLSFTYSVQ